MERDVFALVPDNIYQPKDGADDRESSWFDPRNNTDQPSVLHELNECIPVRIGMEPTYHTYIFHPRFVLINIFINMLDLL